MYTSQERYHDAERLFQQALDILKEASVLNSQDTETIFSVYANLLVKTGQKEEAQRLKERSRQKSKHSIKEG